MTACKLLAIDDDVDFAEGLALALELEGYEVDIASTGRAGVEAAKKLKYAAILIDIGLPDINGVDALGEIRRHDPGARCFLLTGFSADHILEQGIDAGAVEILTKPIEIEELLRKIAAILDSDD